MNTDSVVIDLNIKIYQGSCWICGWFWWGLKPRIERKGIRCPICDRLNRYHWTLAEYQETRTDHKQGSGHICKAISTTP